MNDEEAVLWYFNKNYIIEDKVFKNKLTKEQFFGRDIINEISLVFNVSLDLCDETLRELADNFHLTEDEFNYAYLPIRLKTTWSPELAQDLSAFYAGTEQEFYNVLYDSLKMEMRSPLFDKLFPLAVGKQTDIESIMKCFGYGISPTTYDATDFTPRKKFIRISSTEMNVERKRNPIWNQHSGLAV